MHYAKGFDPTHSSVRNRKRGLFTIWGGWIAFACAASVLIHSGSFAFVPEAPHILDLMIEKISGARSLRVVQKVTIRDEMLSRQPVELNETLSFIFPDQFRSDAWHQDTNRILVVSRGQAVTIIDQKVAFREQGRFDRYKDPLLLHSRQLMLKHLLQSGVDLGVTSLGRMDDRLAYIIGARFPDLSVSQLWVDKESFLPLRWIIVLPVQGAAPVQTEQVDFVFRQWKKHGKAWYPMQIETFRNQDAVRRIEVQSVLVDADFSAELMDLSYMLETYPPIEKDSRIPTSETSLDEVEQTIEDFRRKFSP